MSHGSYQNFSEIDNMATSKLRDALTNVQNYLTLSLDSA